MLAVSDLKFIVLDVEIPLWSILLVFMFIALIAFTIYILIFLNKGKNYIFDNQEVDSKEFLRLEKFEDLRNDFEVEIGQIKKIRKSTK
ncbi:hypothetical protein SCLARK_001452 [Spiroplasma clarkii]|uniref:TIGR04561 family membrane protein n=1 Tax=Spiroplasma clarkii TaxID=2139 RepID=A0A1Y0L2R3_9MOLU|nr:TIGR04561 family membrane protein [Spiroplasma clarkii]ARU91969.1 hypothetical protein SCLARK_001452 [Spiroplasma clarkii]ATX71309.1 hypothetical protein SCLAR_v1c10070 [Spiroplasma clarkii]